MAFYKKELTGEMDAMMAEDTFKSKSKCQRGIKKLHPTLDKYLQLFNPDISESHHIAMPKKTNMSGFSLQTRMIIMIRCSIF